MGVIYKLKKEVVDFIIEKKKEISSISCRKLAELTSEKYQIKVSKSAINAVMKTAQLSSPVGRRPLPAGKSKRFSIPSEKKKQILESFPKTSFKTSSDELERVDKIQPIVVPEITNKIIDEKPTIKEVENKLSTEDRGLQLIPDPLEDISLQENQTSEVKENFFGQVNHLRLEKISKRGSLHENLGLIFLKLAQWEISKKPIFAEVVKKYIQGNSLINLGGVCDLLLFLNALRKDFSTDISIRQADTLNVLVGAKNGDQIISEIKAVQDMPVSFNLIMDYLGERDQSLLEVGHFKIFLQDDSWINIDTQMTSVWAQEIPSQFFWPFQKSLAMLSSVIISNNRPAVFYTSAVGPGILPEFYEMIKIFENTANMGIKKAGVYNLQNQEITNFSIIPSKKRHFIFGLWPHQNEFVDVIKATKWALKEKFYCDDVDGIFYYAETKTDFFNKESAVAVNDFRVVTLWDQEAGDPVVALVTNQQDMTAEEIVKEYVIRWPNFNNKIFLSLKKLECLSSKAIKTELRQSFAPSQITNMQQLLVDFKESLYCYCQNYFLPKFLKDFNPAEFFNSLWTVPGYLREDGKNREVTLILAQNHRFHTEIDFMARIVNEHGVVDHNGQRYWLKVE